MFGGKDIVMAKLRREAARFGGTPRQALSNLYATRDVAQIGKILGVTAKPVREAMNRLNINRRARGTQAPKGLVAAELTRRGRTTNQTARQLFVNLYSRQGKSLQEIADSLDVSLNSVYQFAVKRGINLRRVGRPSGKTRARRNVDIYAGCL